MTEPPEASDRMHGGLRLTYRLEETVPLDGTASYRHVERWAVSVLLDRPRSAGDPVEIGHAHVLVFNLDDGVDIGDLADTESGAWVDIASPAPAAGSRLDDEAPGHVMVLDRVWLRPDHRGRGLGPVVAAAVIVRLGRGCRLAACYPAPFEDTARGQPQDRARAIEALGRIWAKVGFRPWRDGVWMLDLAANDVHSTLVRVLEERRTDA